MPRRRKIHYETEGRRPVWRVHMGLPGGEVQADSRKRALAIQENGDVALGWPELGDLCELPPDPDVFRARVREAYGPDVTEGSVGRQAGMLYRFVHEVRIGDAVVATLPNTGCVRVGRIDGNCRFDESDQEYRLLRRVRWARVVPRTELPDLARRALQGQGSLHEVHSGADEFDRMAGDG